MSADNEIVDMTTPEGRLRHARKTAGFGSATKAAVALGMVPSTYRAHENGQNPIKQNDAALYAATFKVRAEWIMTGEKPMMSPDQINDDNFTETVTRVPMDDTSYADAGTTFGELYRAKIPGAIPEIDVQVGAGDGRIGDFHTIQIGDITAITHAVVAEWVIPEHFIHNSLHASPGRSVIFEIIGDSMEPTLSPGNKVIVDLSQTTITDDTVFVISDGVCPPRVKRLHLIMFSTPQMVEIISDNKNIPSVTVELSRVHIIGRVVGNISRR